MNTSTCGWSRAPCSLAAALLMLLPACGADGSGPENGLEGGVLATFHVVGEQFRIWVTNDSTISQLLDLRAGRSDASIPNGPLLAGSGQASHNDPWSWHLDPDSTSMAFATIEVCDGLPSFVEENLAEWLASVGQYCPWSARLVRLDDFR